MAQPTCPKCDSTTFKVTSQEPIGSQFKVMFIHCNSCGAVVGVTEYYNIGKLLTNLAAKLNVTIT